MKKRGMIYGLMLFLLLGVALLSLLSGSAAWPLENLWRGLCNEAGYERERITLLYIRLPRMLCALIAGVGLSLSGVLLQNVMGNPLASPNIMGVNAGAGLAAVCLLSMAPKWVQALPMAAFAGAFLTALLILAVGRGAGRSKGTVILAGIACTTLFQAGISFLSTLDTDVLSQYTAFAIGSFQGVETERLLLPALLVGVCLVTAFSMSGRIAALSLGDEVASGLGVRVGRMRVFCLLLASMSAAAVVSYAGLLGFVGLVVPHIARKLVGQDMRDQIAASALCGAVLVMMSDWLGRTAFAPSEISVGIVMALIGAPFFFALLLKRRTYAEM